MLDGLEQQRLPYLLSWGRILCVLYFLPSLPHLGGRSALDWWCKHATGTSLLLSPCRHRQREILLPPALHQPPLLLRSIFKQRQDCRATSVCGAWQVCAGPQGGMAQLSFGGISEEGMSHGLPDPEFEQCTWNHPGVVSMNKERGAGIAVWVLMGQMTFLTHGQFCWVGATLVWVAIMPWRNGHLLLET